MRCIQFFGKPSPSVEKLYQGDEKKQSQVSGADKRLVVIE
jgi:hypothetical protein